MNYVTRVLQPGESVVHIARMHPIVFLAAVLWFAAALALLVAAMAVQGDLRIAAEALAAFCAIFGIASGVPALIRRATTELAVTDRRVIYKSGVIARHTLEMNRSKVESVDVDQSIFGRLLNYGDVTIHGTGEGWEPLRNIGAPLKLRNHVTAR